MSYIFLKVPKEEAQTLSKIKVPGVKEDADGFHITLIYFPKDSLTLNNYLKVMKILFNFTKKIKSFKLFTNEISHFEDHGDGTPIFAKVTGKKVFDLREELVKEFDKNKIKFSKKFNEFKPHITLSYSKDGKFLSKDFDKLEMKFDSLFFEVGKADSDQKDFIVEIPFGENKKSDILKKEAAVYQWFIKNG